MFRKYHQKFWHRKRSSQRGSQGNRDFSMARINKIDAKISTYEAAHQKKLMEAFEKEFAKL